MKILFMGTGEIALPSFNHLLESSHHIIGLVTQPDRPVGRKKIITPPKIKTTALEHQIKVWQPEKLKGSSEWQEIAQLDCDVIVVMAYGQILAKEVLALPKIACINLHASLLPRHRGASCIQAALLAGDNQTAVTVMHVAPSLDTGDIILQQMMELTNLSTGEQVHDALGLIAPEALQKALSQFEEGSAQRTAQDDALASYAPKLSRHDGIIDWSKSAQDIERTIRAYHVWPGTSTTFIDAKKSTPSRLKIFPYCAVLKETEPSSKPPGTVLQINQEGLVIACGEGQLQVIYLQPEGSSKMEASQFALGGKIQVGDRLGSATT